MPESAPPLELRSLTKSFDGRVVLDDITLTMSPGELLALVGPSGCGKSTLLRVIAGLLTADAGAVRLAGAVVDDARMHHPPERRSVGLVFQEHALFPHMTVDENVSFGVRRRSDRRARVRAMLELVGLGDYATRYPHELSGGERQRVALARALAPEPAVMLFDEPFASLDHNLRVQLRRQVREALESTRTPAVFVTHDQREALAIGDRIAVLRSGRLEQVGVPSEVFHRPVSRFVGEFMGAASFLPITNGRHGAHSELGPIDIVDGDVGGLCAMVRPDDLAFVDRPDGGCRIVRAEYGGSEWMATAETPSGRRVHFLASHLDQPVVGARGDLAMVSGHCQVPVLGAVDGDENS